MLQAAAYIVCAYLTGMRDCEVQAMRRSCLSDVRSEDGLVERHPVRSTLYKGRSTTGEGVSWVTIEPVAEAITVLGRLSERAARKTGSDTLWPLLRRSAVSKTHLSSEVVRQLNAFRDHLGAAFVSPDTPVIPPGPDGKPWRITARQFRRTIAWHTANRPFGTIAGMIRYKHASVAAFEGYAGTSASGFRAEVEAQRRIGQLEPLLDYFDRRQGGASLAGPAGPRIAPTLDDAAVHLGPWPAMIADRARLRVMLTSVARSLHVRSLAHCFFDPATALCLKLVTPPSQTVAQRPVRANPLPQRLHDRPPQAGVEAGGRRCQDPAERAAPFGSSAHRTHLRAQSAHYIDRRHRPRAAGNYLRLTAEALRRSTRWRNGVAVLRSAAALRVRNRACARRWSNSAAGDGPQRASGVQIMSSPAHADVYARVTEAIIAAIEAGAGTWRMPWHHSGADVTRPTNIASGKPYRGINTVSLWAAAYNSGYASGVWGTYRQWQERGAQVRKGEHASLGVLWKEVSRRDEQDHDDGDDRRRLFARAFSLFNADQVEGYAPEPGPFLPESERLATAEQFIAALGVDAVYGSTSAYYHIGEDRIHMPDFAAFRDAHGFYATHIHEAAHASGAAHRLDRDFSERWTKHALAMEEATAELTASFLLADLGIAHEPRPDHAAYIASWLQLLKDEPRAVFTASSKAQAAADWMHAQQP